MNFILKQIKVWLVLLIISFFILAISYVLGDREGLIIGLILNLILTFFTLFYKPDSIFDELQAQPILGQDPWMLNDLNQYLSSKISIEAPELWVTNFHKPILFIIGPAYYKPSIIVSHALLNNFKPHEIESLMLLSLTNLKYRSNSFAIFFERCALTILSILSFFRRALPSALYSILQNIFTPPLTILFKLSYPSFQQVQSDNEAKKHYTNPSLLAQTLWNLYGTLQTEPVQLSIEAVNYSLIPPQSKTQKLISLHPKIEDRLKNMVGYFPI